MDYFTLFFISFFFSHSLPVECFPISPSLTPWLLFSPDQPRPLQLNSFPFLADLCLSIDTTEKPYPYDNLQAKRLDVYGLKCQDRAFLIRLPNHLNRLVVINETLCWALRCNLTMI